MPLVFTISRTKIAQIENMRLMKAKIREFEGIKYVFIHETEDPDDFQEWLFGQTGPLIPDGPMAAFLWDYERYLKVRNGMIEDGHWD